MLIFTKLEQEPVKAQRSYASVSTVEQSLPSVNHFFQNLANSNPSVFRHFSTQIGSPSFNLFNKFLIALFFVASFSVDSYATHDRGGTLRWQQAGGNTIKFTLNTSWRRSFYGTPVVGSTITLAGGNTNQFNFGDGTVPFTTNMVATVTSVDIAEDVINTTWTTTHTYAQPGNYNVFYTNCCRISTLKEGNNDTDFRLETIVNVGTPFNSPPVSALPAVINLAVGQSAATFTIPFSDPDGNPVTFRAATTAESGLLKPVPTGFTISQTGVMTFNTFGKTVGEEYAVSLMMTDGRTKVPVDFLIEIVPFSQPPFFILPTPLPPTNVFNVLPGNNVSFTVAARDPDAGQFVTLNPVAAPIGSTMNPTLPVSGAVNGTASSTFSWTPAANQVGNYVITFVATDNVGVQKLTSVNINVLCGLNSTVSNTISTSCPSAKDGAAQITVQNFTTASNLIYIWTGPNGFSANTQNIANVGSGSYSVRVIDNANGCSVTKPVTIGTVPDITLPIITCPANIPCVEATNPKGAIVNFPSATASDNCSTVNVTSSMPSGSMFSVGTNTVIYTATDGSNNTANCSFTVTICDTSPPDIQNTPANIPCVEATSSAGAVVTYPNPTATDIVDGAVSVTSLPASGSTFPIGITIVTSTATDAHGNSASTTFTVTVCDRTPPVITCPANIPCVEATSPAGAVVTYSSVMAMDIVDGTISAYSVLPSGSTFAIGSNTVVATATDANGNSASCSFTIQVCDTRPPVITCPANITVEASGPSGAVVTYSSATATDIVDGNVATNSVLPSGSTFPIGLSTVISTATDAHGNSATCSFTIKVNNTPPVITCPANVPCVEATSAAGAIVTYPSVTAIDYTGTSIPVTSVLANGSTFPLGTSTVVATATDNTGKSSSCSFTVEVCDKTSPAITCPSSLNINTSPISCSAVAVFSSPTATDAVTASPTITQSEGLTSGVSYPIGTTTNSFTATDAVGNTSSCSFTVKVTDNIAPVIICPIPLSKNTDLGQCSAITMFVTPIATDNCGATITQTSGLASGASYPKGITTNTFKATDAAGNTSSCSFTITVIDNQKPTITAPAAINACVAVGAPIALGTPITADNCGIASVTNNAPAVYSVGTTIVTWIVTDNSGNTATATQSVTVNYNAFDATKCYKIVNRNANKVLEVSKGSDADNAPILQNEYTGDIFQKWQFVSVGDGYVKIVSKKNGKVMASVTTNNSGRVFQSTYAAGGSMDWKIECLTAPYLKITHRLTGKVLDIKNSTLDVDGPTIVNTFSATSISQQWSVVEVSYTANENLIANSNQPQADAQSLNFSGTNKKRVTDFTIYPNPATKEAWIDMTPFEGQHVMLMVTDILGKMVQQEVVQRASAAPHRLDVVNLPTGLYLVKVQVQGEQVLMKKLQVTKL